MMNIDLLTLLLYLSIPLSSGFIGWFTNVTAIQMLFYPVKYFGIPPFGWQGIVPANSHKMSLKAVDLLTNKLFKIEEHFERLDANRVSLEMKGSMRDLTIRTVDEVMQKELPKVWNTLPSSAKDLVYDAVEENTKHMVEDVLMDIKENIRPMLDLKMLTLEAIERDPQLLNEIFIKCGDQEFRFIEKSGFYFGALFGLTQMAVSIFFMDWWLLPLFGLVVGYLTNWLALKLIFKPNNPIHFLGFTFLGLFLKRQKEVAAEYAYIVTQRIVTTEALFRYVSRSSGKEILSSLIRKRLDNVIDNSYDKVKGIITLWADKQDAAEHINIIKNVAHFRFMQEFPIALRNVYPYADEVFDLNNVIRSKMEVLPYKDFEGVLRPAFQEDEWKLILVGAILGGLAGVLQYIFLFMA
ncbi:hypothetical protein [Algivirga pacifica]|uniref:DUF445 family protein n=1 Tax=Algivirga pacifica TaxID=1162670 RepID=A0ABP9D6L6_9BACT